MDNNESEIFPISKLSQAYNQFNNVDPRNNKTKFFKISYTTPVNSIMVEKIKTGAAITKRRGLQSYDRGLFLSGIDYYFDNKFLEKRISDSGINVPADGLHFLNNPAMQQMWDDIRRSCIIGLDAIFDIIEKRLCKVVTPDDINYYLEYLNHTMTGGAIIQEHLAEINPILIDDCYVKIFTGDELLVDEVDKQFLINIDKEFPKRQAVQIKESIGKTTWQAVHIPTIITRVADGGSVSRWTTSQIGTSLVASLHLCGGEALLAEAIYTAKHESLIEMSHLTTLKRQRSVNEPGGLSFGHLSDIIQAGRIYPKDPYKVSLETIGVGSVLYDQIWMGGYLSGGVGLTHQGSSMYTNDILDDFIYYSEIYRKGKYGKELIDPSMDIIKDMATEMTLHCLEEYEENKLLLEEHFGGSQRSSVIATAAGTCTGIATGNTSAGLSAFYLSMALQKEAWGRLGGYGYDMQDQCGASNVFSIQSDEGLLLELRGPNYPNFVLTEGHLASYAGIVSGAHAGKGDAFALNPLIKVCFADEQINFDFSNPRKEFGLGALRIFDVLSGERKLIIPSIKKYV